MSITIRKIYNPLNNLVKRIKEDMETILITIGMALIPTSIALLCWDYDHKYPFGFMLLTIVCFVSGFVCWNRAITLAHRRDVKENESRAHLTSVLDSIESKLGKNDNDNQKTSPKQSNTSKKK